MDDFYRKSGEQQAQAYEQLARVALKRWGIEDSTLALLKQRENAVFSVVTGNGEKFALRIHRANYHTDIEVWSELQWMKALDEKGVHTPLVILSNNNKMFEIVSTDSVPEPRQVDLFEWVDGEIMGTLGGGVTGNVEQLVSDYRLLGELAAHVHNQAASWKSPQTFSRHKWNVAGLVGDDPVWGREWEHEALTNEEREQVLKIRGVVREKLVQFGTGSDRYGLIHADFLPENVIVSDGQFRLIDFDDCGYGWHLFELATSVFVHFGEDHFDQVFEALIEGYRLHRPLPEEHLQYFPYFIMARLLSYLGWLHTREKTAMTQEMTPIVIKGIMGYADAILGDAA